MIFSAVIPQDLRTTASPTFVGLNLSGLSASQAIMTDASKNFVSADYLNQAVKTTSSPTFSELLFTSPTSQNYQLTNSGGFLALQGQTSGQHTHLRMFAKDGDGTDNVLIQFFGSGTPAIPTTNTQWAALGYLVGVGYIVGTFQNGTGVLQPIKLFTGSNSGQLDLLTNGNIAMGYNLAVTSNISAASLIPANGWSGSFLSGNGGTVTVVSGIITEYAPP